MLHLAPKQRFWGAFCPKQPLFQDGTDGHFHFSSTSACIVCYATSLVIKKTFVVIFTVRRYALHGLCDRNSVCPSVRLSVRPSVTLVDCVHMVRPTIMISSPYGSPIILVSGDIKFIPQFEGGHPERGRWMRVGWVRIGDFRPISRRISETVRDTTKATINH